MSKVFQVKPKRLKRSNGTVLTPDMVVTVTTMQHTATPFYIMEPRRCKKPTCASMLSIIRKHAAIRMISNLRSWTKNENMIWVMNLINGTR